MKTRCTLVSEQNQSAQAVGCMVDLGTGVVEPEITGCDTDGPLTREYVELKGLEFDVERDEQNELRIPAALLSRVRDTALSAAARLHS